MRARSAITATVAAAFLLIGLGGGTAVAQTRSTDSEAFGSGGTLLNLTVQNGQIVAPASFSFTARATNGNPARSSGYVRATPRNQNGTFEQNGPVTCLDVRGNTFGLVYRLDETSKPPQSGFLYITGIDNGIGGRDYAGIFVQGQNLPAGCAPRPLLNNLGPVTDGNIVVRPAR